MVRRSIPVRKREGNRDELCFPKGTRRLRWSLCKSVSIVTVVCLMSIPREAHAAVNMDAVNSAAKALYEYEGWDKVVADYAKHWENKFTPRQKKWGGMAFFVAKVIMDQRVEFTWSFP